MTGRSGIVWYGRQRVGNLREDEDQRLLFAYDNDWLNEGGFPVSISLPLTTKTRRWMPAPFSPACCLKVMYASGYAAGLV